MTREQLELARRQAFSVEGNALLTLEDARTWVDRMGLVLWTPKGQQLPAPAPSFVAAVSGVAEPGIEEASAATSMLGRLVREGAVVPLLLMGGAAPSDSPDFLVSAAALPYVYTLRGAKNWKAAPAASSLSPLAFNTWEILKANGAQTNSELVQELGREVTQVAVLRALAELWSVLRVIPVPQENGEEAKWELLTARFTKAMKSGGNAGVPTALSAMVSLYLGAVLVAETEEIETFLSPLIARSKVRDAVSGLNAARQLDEVVLEGKTLLHVRGDLPEFPEIIVPEAPAVEGEESEGTEIELGSIGEAEPDREAILERSRKRVEKTFAESREGFDNKVPVRTRRPFDPQKKPFVRKPAADGDRPARKPFDGERKPFRPRTEGEGGGERRPYVRKSFEGGDRPARKPFDGERKPFRPRTEGDGGGERRPYVRKPFDGERKPFRPRTEGGGERRPYERKPFDGERKPFRPRTEGEGGGERRPYVRKPFDGERKPFDGERRPFRPRTEGEGGGERRPYVRKPFDGERKPFRPRTEGEGGGERRPYVRKPYDGERKPFDGERKPFRPRTEGDGGGERRPYARKPFDGERKPFARKPFDGERKPFRPRTEGEGGGERKPYARKPFDGERKPFARKPFDGERKSFRPRTDGDGGDRKPFARKPFDGERKPFRPRTEGEGGGERKPYARKPFDGERKSFGGDRKPSFGGPKKFGGARPAGGSFGGPKKFGSKPGGAGKFGGPKKFGGARPGGPAKPFAPRKKREDGE